VAKTKGSQTLTILLLMLCGVVIGAFLADLTHGVEGLSWLSYGHTFGIGGGAPLTLDLSVVRLTFGLSVHLNIGTILGMALAFYSWRKWF